MSTVGYGDLVPKYTLGKVYAIIWMITAMSITSLFTANVSSAMTSKYLDEKQSLLGKKLGVIKGTRLFFENEINFGAAISEYKEDQIFSALLEGNVSRILLPDFLEAMYYLTTSRSFYFHKNIRIVETIKHPYSFGITVWSGQELNTQFLGCLRMWLKSSYIMHNHIDYSAIDANIIKQHSLKLMEDELTTSLVIALLSTSVVVLVLGIVVWIIRPMIQTRFSNNDIKNSKRGDKMNEVKT
ncbi:uncharacterized protein LOC114517958 [Dendronephthya gigantea]|uniref:uncharacterized protein LOC114517958 n=1 Tax=Dendronephthya gigantea TaxID=151771 RepID=UPI00106A10D6|nr:uncharacterized protein LOC114517958 [Dendronephthya gigantea]